MASDLTERKDIASTEEAEIRKSSNMTVPAILLPQEEEDEGSDATTVQDQTAANSNRHSVTGDVNENLEWQDAQYFEEGADDECETESAGTGATGNENRVKLTRSHAIRDSTSPPLSNSTGQQAQVNGGGVGGMNEAAAPAKSPSLVSGAGSDCDKYVGSDPGVNDTDSGFENEKLLEKGENGCGEAEAQEDYLYTDSTGTDLTQFIINTLNKNTKDRMIMLKLEQEMTALVKDQKKNMHKFPHMTSYHRMLVHRVAAYFGLDHNVDQSGNCVIVNKNKTTRLPEMKFKDHIPDDGISTANSSEQRRVMMKRDQCSYDSGDRMSEGSSRRSKSIEEREDEYERTKRRIFSSESRDSSVHGGQPLQYHHQLHHLHHNQSYKYSVNLGSTKGANQARSFDMRDSLRDSADRPQVSKSFSFGGYPAAQHLEPPHRGSISGGPPKGAGGTTPPTIHRNQVMWVVTDMSQVPKGSILINPDTGSPFLNSDGSVYMFDPINPPRFNHQGMDDSLSPLSSNSSGSLLLQHHQQMHQLQQDLANKFSLETGGNSGSGGGTADKVPIQQQPGVVYAANQGWLIPNVVGGVPVMGRNISGQYVLVNSPIGSLTPQYLPYLAYPSQDHTCPPGSQQGSHDTPHHATPPLVTVQAPPPATSPPADAGNGTGSGPNSSRPTVIQAAPTFAHMPPLIMNAPTPAAGNSAGLNNNPPTVTGVNSGVTPVFVSPQAMYANGAGATAAVVPSQPPPLPSGTAMYPTAVVHSDNGAAATIMMPPFLTVTNPVTTPTSTPGGGGAASCAVLAAPQQQRPFFFTVHRSSNMGGVVLLLQQWFPFMYTRAQLQALLDPLLVTGGSGAKVQYLDPPTNVWSDIKTLPAEAVVTNRYPVQVVFDREETANRVIANLKSTGFIMDQAE